jgi:hypothetical protein
MRVVLSTLTYDPQGYIELHLDPRSELLPRERRVTRVETLDGGVQLDDNGMTHGDRTFRLVVAVNKAQWQQLTALHDNYSLLHCATEEGLFLVAPQRLVHQAGRAYLTVLVKAKEG